MSKDTSRAEPKNQATPAAKPAGVLSRFLALEPRVLLDAAAVETFTHVIDGVDAATAGAGDPALGGLFADGGVVASTLSGAGGAREILFVDSSVENYEALVRDVDAGVEVHVLTGNNWAAQVQAVLGRRDGDVSAIHLVTHGGAGHLNIGGETVDSGNLDTYARAWSAMRQALTDDGDILVYGCDVAAGDAGAGFVQALADRTGADIAASTDLSGVTALGGDWQLEYRAGSVDADSLYANGEADDFLGVLADGWVQDTEITAGTSSVAMTHTTDGKDWKFVGLAGSNRVDIYVRNVTTGAWGNGTTAGTPFAQVTGNGSGNFGFDIAAAGNKLVVSAPNFDNGTNDGRVYNYSYNAGAWALTETIVHRTATGSGQTGDGANQDNDSGNDQFGYSIDLAWDGGTSYRLIIGNPNEDWWNRVRASDGWGGDTSYNNNTRFEAGVAHVYSTATHTGLFAFQTQIESQQGGTIGNNHQFGGVVAAGYDYDSANWWYAVGGDGLDAVRMYDNPGAGTIGGGTFNGSFAWDSAGYNDVSMDDDYMLIANAGSIVAYKVDAASNVWSQIGSGFGGTNSVVMVDDWDQSAAGDSTHGARMIYSYTNGSVAGTLIADVNSSGQFSPWFQLNSLQETAVAIDRYYSIDMLSVNGTGARSYHYNWDPDVVNDSNTGTEDSSMVTSVLTNDSDINITSYGSVSHGDALTVTGVSASGLGATVTYTSTQVTYNASASAYLQTLKAGQSVSENITVTISDGQGPAVTSTLAITVNGANDAPTANSLTAITPYAIQQSGSTNAYDFSAYFDDVDSGEDALLAPSATATPGGWTWVTDGTLLRVTIPQGTAAGDYTITVRVQDPNGVYSGTKNFTIRVDAANDAPVVAVPIPDQVALVGYEYSYTVPEATFNDADPAPYDVLTYTATLSSGAALPAWLSFDAANRTFSGSPAAGDVGTITVRVRVTDDAASKGRGANLTTYDDYTLVVANPAPKTLSAITDGPAASADFGFSCAISEDGGTMIVGAPGNNTIWHYNWNGSGWNYIGGITGPVANAKFGWSVDLSADGRQLVVGARNETVGANVGQGAVYCYDRASAGATAFTAKGKIVATGGIANDYFGTSVGINEAGNNVIIGASHFDYSTYSDSGAAFWVAFQATAGTYSFAPNVLPKDPTDFDRFGTSVAFDENIIVVSAVGDDNASGMVTRIEFDDVAGTYASPTFGSIGGTLSSGAQFAYDGTRGDVMYLTGSNGKVTLDTPVDIGTSWTISAWYKGLRTVGAGEWRTLTRGSSDHHIIVNDTGLLGVYDNSGAVAPVSGFVSSGYDMDVLSNTVWHHIVAVGDGTTTTFYIDGVKVGAAVAERPTDDIVVVGNYQGDGQRFSDYIDDFRIYGRALSQSEIRNIYSGVETAEASYGDTGSIYVWATDTNSQVAKLYAPDGATGDMVGWSIDVDIYTYASVARMGGVIVASSIFNDENGTDGGAVYVWRSIGQQTGGTDNNGTNGNGTWRLETKLTSFDTTPNDYYGNDVAIDYDEATGGQRLLVGAPFEDAVAAYSGAVYAYKFSGGVWMPEKFTDATPQGGSMTTAEFFGSAVAVADTRAVIGARWRDNGGQTNDGAVFWANLLTQGNYSTVLSAETAASGEFFLPATVEEVVSIDTSNTQGTVSFDTDGRLVYKPGDAFKSLGIGQTATDTFTYVSFVGDASYTNTVNITVVGTDDPLTLGNDYAEVSASAPTLVNVLANDADADAATPLTILSVSDSGLQGSIQVTADGLVFDPNGQFDALRAGEKIQQTITYTVRDDAGNDVTASVTLVVVGEDDPVVTAPDNVTTQADTPVTINVLANDSDDDGAGTFGVATLDTTATRGSVTINPDGTLTYVAGDAFRYLKAGETAEDQVVYIARDETGNQAAGLLTILVIGVDDAPTAQDDRVDVAPAASATVNVLANDVDPDGDALRVSRVITDQTQGTVTLNADGTITYRAPAGEITIDRFSYEIVDTLGNTSVATVFVNEGGGVPPVDPTVPVARDYVRVLDTLDSNIGSVTRDDNGATLTGIGSAGYGQVSIENGLVRYTPDSSLATLPAGTFVKDVIEYTLSWPDGRTDTATITFYINGHFSPSNLDDDDERFALPTASWYVEGVVLQQAPATLVDTSTAPSDAVADAALDAMIEMAEEDAAADAEAPLAARPAVEPAPLFAAKPDLSSMLGREVQARRADVDALLRHFSA